MLSLKLPQLLQVHQVPRVRGSAHHTLLPRTLRQRFLELLGKSLLQGSSLPPHPSQLAPLLTQFLRFLSEAAMPPTPLPLDPPSPILHPGSGSCSEDTCWDLH